MKAKPAPPGHGFTTSKLGLIGVLAVVLIATMVYQFGGGESQPLVIKKRTPRASDGGAPAGSAGAISGNRDAAGTPLGSDQWPEISLVEAARFDPFAFPRMMMPIPPQSASWGKSPPSSNSSQSENPGGPDLAESAGGKSARSPADGRSDLRSPELKRRLEEQQAVATELQRRGVGLILRTARGSVARIGDLEVRVGDTLNGLRVAAIEPDGIRLVAEIEVESKALESQ